MIDAQELATALASRLRELLDGSVAGGIELTRDEALLMLGLVEGVVCLLAEEVESQSHFH